MNIQCDTFYKINKISKSFIIIVLTICILLNIIDIIRFSEFLNIKYHIFSILILIIFIVSLYFENFFTTFALFVLNILFWYFIITEPKDLSWYDNPFNHYDMVLNGFANLFAGLFKLFLTKIISSISLFNNILIWTIIIPFRIYKLHFKKVA